MRTSPASPPAPHGRGLALAAVVTLLLALAAVPALAQDSGDGDDADTGGDAGGVCAPELVTHTPDGSSGVEVAVAITSQAIDKGVAGWISVSWQVADGAELTGLTVTEIDGSVSTLTDDIDSGSLFDVAELRFCGSYDGEVSVSPEPPVEDDDEGTDDDAGSGGSGGDDTTDGTDDDGSSTGGGTDGSTGGSGDDGSGSAGESDDTGGSGSTDGPKAGADDGSGDDHEVVSVPAPEDELDLGDEVSLESAESEAETDADSAEDTVGDDVTEEDTEVLGVQLTREDPEPGGAPAWLIIAGVVLLGLVGYGAFRLRHAIG